MRLAPMLATVVSLLIALALVVGCGGTNDDGDAADVTNSTAAASPRAEFVRAGNRACEEIIRPVQARLDRALSASDKRANLRKLLVQVIAPAFERQAQALREAEPPPGDEKPVAEIVAALQAVADKATTGDIEGFIQPSPYRRSERLAKDYGLDACGTP